MLVVSSLAHIRVFSSAVALVLRGFYEAVVGEIVVVLVDYGCHVLRAAVASFYVVLVEDACVYEESASVLCFVILRPWFLNWRVTSFLILAACWLVVFLKMATPSSLYCTI